MKAHRTLLNRTLVLMVFGAWTALISGPASARIIGSGDRGVVLAADLSEESGDITCDIDVDGQVGTDFVVRLKWLTWNEGDDFRYDVRLESGTSGAYVAPDDGRVGLLQAGATVGPGSTFRSCGTEGGTIVWYVSDDDAANGGGHWGLPWSDVTTTGFIGVRVPPAAGGFDRFGWIRLSVAWDNNGGYSEPCLTVTVHDWATDIVPLTPIGAGVGPNYADWAGYTFDPSLPLESTLPHADPDGDGLVNLSEYGFMRDPETSDVNDAVLDITLDSDGRPVLGYGRRLDDANIAVVVDVSDDLSVWVRAPPADFSEFVHTRIGSDPPVAEWVRATYVAGDSADRRYFRLAIIQLP